MSQGRVALACALFSLAGCSRNEGDDAATAQAASTPRAVTVARVDERRMAQNLSLSGTLVAREETSVSSQLSGYPVLRVLADQDDEVRAGQILAVLDDTLLRADIAQQRAALAQQRIAAERAAAEAGRVAGLENSGVLSSEAVAERLLSSRSANASVTQSEAQLQSLLVKERLMEIRAPVSGRILSRAVRPGDIASPGTILFRMARDSLVEVDAETPEASINLVRVGQPAQVTLPTGLVVPGTVRLVSAEIDAQTKLGRTRILMKPNRALRPGGFADVRLAVSESSALAVPEAAVIRDEGGASVMVLDARDRVHSLAVTTGVRSSGWVQLLRGPSAGTRVLTGGQGFVLDGDAVKPESSR